jgi:hypothetical protein
MCAAQRTGWLPGAADDQTKRDQYLEQLQLNAQRHAAAEGEGRRSAPQPLVNNGEKKGAAGNIHAKSWLS